MPLTFTEAQEILDHPGANPDITNNLEVELINEGALSPLGRFTTEGNRQSYWIAVATEYVRVAGDPREL